ncbi:MAG: hypothetical protein AAB404_00515 [Patescibacteria group bacterium]
MKRMTIVSCWLLLILILNGCATTTTVIEGNGPDPAGEAYKAVLIRNESPFYVYFSIGTRSIILKPGNEVIIKTIRPLGWLSPTFGSFSFIAYAYRQYDGKGLDEFVGQQEYWVYLDGRLRIYQGRGFGDVVIMEYFPVSALGHPDRWQGNFLRTVPWKAEFKHQ